MIIHKKMSLFDAPKDSALIHACNAQGVWGSGIAREMKERFPGAFKRYNEYCTQNPKEEVLGSALCIDDNDMLIVNLITSLNYGDKVDSPESILKKTENAILDFLPYIEEMHYTTVYSNKFNSGLFKVPWEQTEALIERLTKHCNVTWIVCSPD